MYVDRSQRQILRRDWADNRPSVHHHAQSELANHIVKLPAQPMHGQFSQSPTGSPANNSVHCVAALFCAADPFDSLKRSPCRPGRLAFFLLSSERLLLELPPFESKSWHWLLGVCFLFLSPTLYFYSNSIPTWLLPSHHQTTKPNIIIPINTNELCSLCCAPFPNLSILPCASDFNLESNFLLANYSKCIPLSRNTSPVDRVVALLSQLYQQTPLLI